MENQFYHETSFHEDIKKKKLDWII